MIARPTDGIPGHLRTTTGTPTWVRTGCGSACGVMKQRAAITGWGWYSPKQVLTNDVLAQRIDTSDHWVRSRTGIRQRHVAGPGETTSSMGLAAARQALAESQLDADDLDLVVCTTTTPDHLLPSSACLIQQRLGAGRAGAFDLNAACS